MKRTIVGAFVAPVVLAISAASAAPPRVPTATVSFADLDIKHEAGAQELWMRVQSASRRVCGAQPSIGDLHNFSRWEACVANAEKTSIARINSPVVSRVAGIPIPAVRTANN